MNRNSVRRVTDWKRLVNQSNVIFLSRKTACVVSLGCSEAAGFVLGGWLISASSSPRSLSSSLWLNSAVFPTFSGLSISWELFPTISQVDVNLKLVFFSSSGSSMSQAGFQFCSNLVVMLVVEVKMNAIWMCHCFKQLLCHSKGEKSSSYGTICLL